jgi:hypothetical protein
MALSQFKKDEIAFELRHEDDPAFHTKQFAARSKPAPKEYSTQDVLAVACAAHRINGGYLKQALRFSEDKPTQHSNKEMVKFYFAMKEGRYVDRDFTMFAPNEDDYAHVETIRNHFKRYSMELLGDSLSGFQKDCFTAISNDTVLENQLGVVAYVPELVKREKHENSVKKTIRVEYRDSKHIGTTGDTVEGVIKILDKQYSQKWESYNYTAVLDGNLVSFMNKFDHAVDGMKRIKAKVRDHTQNRLFSANETRLNYVKLFKV